jgi:uncharacterized protein (TIGR02246 family)
MMVMTADERSIQDILRRMEAAWNASDSAGIAALFAEDANFIQIFGGQLDGRAAIEGSHRAILDTIYKDSRARFDLREIRSVRPDVAIVFTKAAVEFKEGDEMREIKTRPTMVVEKDGDTWRIVAFQNTRISEMPAGARSAARFAT